MYGGIARVNMSDSNYDDSFSGVTYEIVAFTSSENFSGTDSSVYVTLVGDGGDSGEFELAQSEHFNKFETGQSDTFAFRSNVALGYVQEVHVRIVVASLIKRSWHLEAIEVRGGDLEEPIRFAHDQVISPDNPTVVLSNGQKLNAPHLATKQFFKSDGELWEPEQLRIVETAFRNSGKNFIRDRR